MISFSFVASDFWGLYCCVKPILGATLGLGGDLVDTFGFNGDLADILGLAGGVVLFTGDLFTILVLGFDTTLTTTTFLIGLQFGFGFADDINLVFPGNLDIE
jgi:hypothetical protein